MRSAGGRTCRGGDESGHYEQCFTSRTQLADGTRVFGKNRRRAVEDVAHDGVWVDAEVVVDGGEDVAEMDRVLRGVTADAVGGAEHLAGGHAAARHDAVVDRSPMVAASVAIDARRAAELTPHDHADVVGQAALV